MNLVFEGMSTALWMLLSGDREVLAIAVLTLAISIAATVISLIVGLPFGTFLALVPFPGRQLVMSLVNTGMGLPPVVVGLFVMILLWRSGPLGELHLLFTPGAMIIAQFIISFPVVVGLTVSAIQSLHPKLRLQILALGANRWQMFWLLSREARLPLMAAVMAGFGAVISEVGASMMVGGNIRGQTRVLTTATVTEAGRGEFGIAMALSILLLLLVYLVNLVLTWLQQRRAPS